LAHRAATALAFCVFALVDPAFLVVGESPISFCNNSVSHCFMLCPRNAATALALRNNSSGISMVVFICASENMGTHIYATGFMSWIQLLTPG